MSEASNAESISISVVTARNLHVVGKTAAYRFSGAVIFVFVIHGYADD